MNARRERAARASRALLLSFVALACDSHTLHLLADGRDAPRDASRQGSDASRSGNVPIEDAMVSPAVDPSIDAASIPMLDAALGPSVISLARCGSARCACDDGRDNDQDGLVDGLDPECTGVVDEDESSFATGKAPKTKACRDCFWDGNSGGGNDACRYPEACLRGAAPGGGGCSSCEVSDQCVARCQDSTPNGCDCFGCCEVARDSGSAIYVELRETCSLAVLDDTDACPRCVPSTQCQNLCGRCELCPGRDANDLPADCRSSTPTGHVCDEGQPVCQASSQCPIDMYCQLGCCLPALL